MFIIKPSWLNIDPSKNETYEDWNKTFDVTWQKLNKADEIISKFYLKYCTREDFANFNATDIYDDLDALDLISDKKTQARYCFDFRKNETLPEYGIL